MALTTNATTQVTQLYVAMFGRAPDMEGLNFWGGALDAGQSVAQVAQAMFATSPARAYFPAGSSSEQIVQAFYVNVLGRQPDAEGLAFWVARLDALKGTGNTNAVGQVITEIISIVDNYQGNTPEGAASAQLFANKIQVANFWTTNGGQDAEGNAAPGGIVNSEKPIQLVTADIASVNQVKVQILTGFGDIVAGNVFTLKEAVLPGEAPVAGQKVIYWGYNPHDEHDEIEDPSGIPADGGVPVADMLSFLTSITGLDLAELGLIDDDGVGPFDNVTSLTISNALSMTNSAENAQSTAGSGGNDNSGQSPQLSITYADGTFREFNIEAQIADSYFDFLNNLLFDANGNSRLYEVTVGGSSGSEDSLQPIRLTPNNNNGGTIETGFTTAGNDTIVAGRLELLHGAYIDGGAGRNVLEIEAKGTYAQPAQLLNIHEVRVHDLPNFYTTDYGSGDGYLDNTLFNGYNLPQLPDGPGRNSQDYYNVGAQSGNGDSSWIDLSRAIHIDKLVVTDAGGGSGNLAIVGVRNGATLRLEGSFLQANQTDTNVTTIQYGQGQTGTMNVELAVGDVQADINILQNASVLNIDSQGVENHMHAFFAGGSVSRMNVTGTGVFAVDENLASSFNQLRPVIINAAANTGGLDITLDNHENGSAAFAHYKVTVTGTTADDEIAVRNIATDAGQGSVTIVANNGNNIIDTDGSQLVSITSGTGNDVISAKNGIQVVIEAGDGRNTINADGSMVVDITTGVGADSISAKNAKSVLIDAGDGNNTVNADVAVGNANYGVNTVNITTGAGNDTISAVRAGTVTIDAGAGSNTITVSANEINVTTGDGNDKVYISGMDILFDQGDAGVDGVSDAGGNNDWNDDNYGVNPHFADEDAPGALLNLSLGAGSNTIYLGRDVTDVDNNSDVDVEFGITALEGSVITGTGIKLFVENHSDLTQADLTGATITSVVLKQELRITAEQFTDIGAAAFSVIRDEEGATEDLYIVVSDDVSLTDLLNGQNLATSVRLHFELRDGATLTLTAEQLHKYVAWHGIDSTDGNNGKVIITDAGQNFDPFDNGNNYQVTDGGSLTDSFAGSEDITILRKLDGGFERPVPAGSTDTLVLDSNVDATIETPIKSEVATLKIVGDADITFSHKIDLGSELTSGVLLADGTRGDTAQNSNPAESDLFTIDFSALNGNVVNLTIANFQDVKQIKGNGSATRDVRLDVELADASAVGASGNNNGLKSSGVQTYVVTAIGDDSVGEDSAASSAEFYVCDLTDDVTTLGLRGNHNDTITFKQVNWGTNFLLEAGGRNKADGNPSFANVGTLGAEYFWTGAEPHADAVVDIVNLDTGTVRPVNAAGIAIDNADSITINVAGATDAVIQSLSGNSVEELVFTAAGNVTVRGGLENVDSKGLKVLDASGVTGTFTLDLSNNDNTDLSGATVTGLDKVIFSGEWADLTLTAEQLLDLGIGNISSTATATGGELHVTEYAGQAIDFSAIDVAAIEDLTFADVNGTINVDAAAVFGNAALAVQEVTILAETSDTTVVMTAAQFNQLEGDGTVSAETDASAATGVEFKATLVLNDLAADTVLNLGDVTAAGADGVSVVVRAEDVVATEDFSITGHAYALEVAGAVDLTDAAALGTVSSVAIDAGATLTLTAAQVLAIGFADANSDGVADAWSGAGTLNIVDLSNQELDLDMLAAAGLTIGTITLANTDAPITIDADTTFGGAAQIITPTWNAADTVPGTETTSVTMSVAQYLTSAGVITGGAKVNLTALTENNDSDADFAADNALVDTSGITAPKGTITLSQPTVTLNAASDISGFTIVLATGQMIQFATPEQADGAKIDATGTTGVAWLFTSLGALAQIDTAGYDSNLTTLFISEDLVDGVNEESLWTTLAEGIVVEKYNETGVPDVLISYARTNTFNALSGINGVVYDDTTEFGSIRALTINLEGNTNIGDVTIGDSNGANAFRTLTINSYFDETTLQGSQVNVGGFVPNPNIVGDITITGTADDDVTVTINTYNSAADGDLLTPDGGFEDGANVNEGVAERPGLAIEVGTITFAAEAGNDVDLVLTGAEDITIADLDISDADITLLTVDAEDHTGDLEIGGIAPVDGINDFDFIYVVDGHTAEAGDMADAGNNLLVVAGGTNDLTEAGTADIDAVHFTGNATLTLTAAQIIAIGEGNFSIAPGAVVTVNVEGLTGAAIDLNALQDAGINIGLVTVEDADVVLDANTTLGGADELRVVLNDNDRTLTLTAEQYQQLNGGNITELDTDLSLASGVDKANVIVTDLIGIATINANGPETASIDLSTVSATGTLSLQLADAGTAADIILDAASNLGDFQVVLDSIGNTLNSLAGQTVRFSTVAQADGRVIVVANDDGASDNSTNVVWLFETVPGGVVDTAGYPALLGRLWISENLAANANIETLTTTLAESIIVRIVNADDLTAVLPATQGYDREVEIESFTVLGTVATPADLTFADIDDATQPFDFVENLTISLGGNVTMGDITVSNVLAAPISNNDQFDTLTINSYLANAGSGATYLLPEGYTYGNNPGEIPYPTLANTVGDVQAGAATFELRNVTVETDNPTAGTNDLNMGTVYFSDDGFDAAGVANVAPTTATFTVDGDGDVTVKSLDTSDADIGALTIDMNGTGVLTVTGGSPAFDGGNATGNTETLTIDVVAGGEVVLGSAKAAPATGFWAGVYGEELSDIVLNGAGDVNLGVIAAVDSVDFTLDGNTTGAVTFTLGEADANGLKAPTLAANGVWTFDFVAGTTVAMTVTEDVTFNAGGTLTLNNVDVVTISGNVNLSILVDNPATAATTEGLILTGTTTFEVPAGSTLTLTAEQADGLTVTGGGAVVITGVEDVADPSLLDFSNIMTMLEVAGPPAVAGDSGSVTVTVDTSDDADVDTNPETITLDAAKMGVANIVVSGNGTLQFNNDFTAYDRDGVGATPADVASVTVGAAATVTLTAAQADGLVVDGAGTVNVTIALPSAVDLSGLTATTVNAAVTGAGAFTGDFGSAVVTLGADATNLSADITVLDGVTIGYARSADGATVAEGATVTVTTDMDSAGGDVDLSGVTVRNIVFAAAAVVGTVTFPALATETITDTTGPTDNDYVQSVTLTSAQADGQTITGEGNVTVNGSAVNDDPTAATLDFDLSGITATDPDDTGLPAFNANNLVFNVTRTNDANDMTTLAATADFGDFDVVIPAGETLVATGAQISGLDVSGAGTIRVTGLTTGVDLSGVAPAGGVIGVVSSGAVDLSDVTGLTAIDVDTGANADLTITAAQFQELTGGSNVFAVDLAELNTLTVDVVYTISSTDFDVDLVITDEAVGTWSITGDAAGFVQAQTDAGADANWFTTNVLNSAKTITHTDLGSLVSASSGAAGFAGVVDTFVFDGTIAAAPNYTAITTFSGFGGDGDKVDLSTFNDADNSPTDLLTLGGNLTITNDSVYFVTGGAAGQADSAATAATYLESILAITEAAGETPAYFVVVDDNSTGIFRYVLGTDNDTLAGAELQLIGTVDTALQITDLIA